MHIWLMKIAIRMTAFDARSIPRVARFVQSIQRNAPSFERGRFAAIRWFPGVTEPPA